MPEEEIAQPSQRPINSADIIVSEGYKIEAVNKDLTLPVVQHWIQVFEGTGKNAENSVPGNLNSPLRC